MSQKGIVEKFSVEEVRIDLASLHPEARQIWKFFDRNRIGDFEAELEIIRRLRHHPIEKFVARELIERRVYADCFEDLGIFAQTILLEPFHGNFAPVFVALRIVKLAQPTLILPRGRADVVAALCKLLNGVGESCPVKAHDRGITLQANVFSSRFSISFSEYSTFAMAGAWSLADT